MARSAMAAMPWLRTSVVRSCHAAGSIVADVQTSASALTAAGRASAISIAIIPPSETPATAARVIPAPAIAAKTSSASPPSV